MRSSASNLRKPRPLGRSAALLAGCLAAALLNLTPQAHAAEASNVGVTETHVEPATAGVEPDTIAPAPRPPSKAAAWNDRAHAALRANNQAGARVAANRALKEAPNDVDLMFMVARLEGYQGQYATAEARLVGAYAMAPGYADLAIQLARTRLWDGRPEAAAGPIDAVLLKTPDNLEARILRGDIAQRLGDPIAAEHHFTMVLDALATMERDALALEQEPDAVRANAAMREDVEWRLVMAVQDQDDDRALDALLATLPQDQDDERRAYVRDALRDRQQNVRVDAAMSNTFVETGDWLNLNLGLSARFLPRMWAGARVEWDSRRYGDLRLQDVSILAPMSLEVAPGLTLLLEGGGAPRADVVARGRARMLLEHTLTRHFGYALGYRFARYTDVDTHTVNPGLHLRAWRLTFEPMLFLTHTSLNRTHATASLQITAKLTERGSIDLTAMVGTEPVEPSLAVLRDAPTQLGILAGVSQRVGPTTRLRFLYALWTPLTEPDDIRVNTRHTLALHLVQFLHVRPRGSRP